MMSGPGGCRRVAAYVRWTLPAAAVPRGRLGRESPAADLSAPPSQHPHPRHLPVEPDEVVECLGVPVVIEGAGVGPAVRQLTR